MKWLRKMMLQLGSYEAHYQSASEAKWLKQNAIFLESIEQQYIQASFCGLCSLGEHHNHGCKHQHKYRCHKQQHREIRDRVLVL